MPPCRSSHSEDLSSLPAPSSRGLIRASRSLLRRSTFAAVSFAEAKVTSVSNSGPPSAVLPPAAWISVYRVTRSAALTACLLAGHQEDHEEHQAQRRGPPGRRRAPTTAASRSVSVAITGVGRRLDRRERLGA